MSMTTPTPMPSPSAGPSTKKKTKGIETVASDAAKNAASGVTKGTGSSTRGLDGRPLGSPIVSAVEEWRIPLLPGEPVVTKYTQYFQGSGRTWFQTLKNQERAEYLGMLSQIPGLYSKGKALNAVNLKTLASGGTMIPLRPEDATAIEKVMLYADTVGTDVQQAIRYLYKTPDLARTYFDVSGLTAGSKKVRLTPDDILKLELNQTFQDFLDLKLDKDTAERYVDTINSLEVKRGGAITVAERQKVMLDLVQGKARELGNLAPDTLAMQKGALGGAFNALRKAYRDYGVTVDDKTIYKQAIQSIRSEQAFDNIVQKIQVQAQVSFPALEKYYAQGLSTREALSNYIGLKSKMYNVPEIDINIDEIYPALKGKELMSMDEWKKYLYTLPEFKNTDLYKQRQFSDAQALMRNFFGGSL